MTEVDEHLKEEVIEYQESMNVDFQHKIKKWMKAEGKTEDVYIFLLPKYFSSILHVFVTN